MGTFSLAILCILNIPSTVLAQEERIPGAIRGVAPAATVRIETPGNSGSGVVIANSQERCTLLTAFHVAQQLRGGEQGEIRFQNGGRMQLDSSMVRRVASTDMAIIEANARCPVQRTAILGSANDIMIGDLVYVSGYSANVSPEVSSTSYRISQGRILSISEQPDGYSLFYDALTISGMSGGPLFSSKGLLVGIHGRGETLGLTGQKVAAMAMSVRLLGPGFGSSKDNRNFAPTPLQSPGSVRLCPGVIC